MRLSTLLLKPLHVASNWANTVCSRLPHALQKKSKFIAAHFFSVLLAASLMQSAWAEGEL